MIRYRLQCAEGHEFDAWFASAQAYDQQVEAGDVSCVHCGSPRVQKTIMAPRLAKPAKPKDNKAGEGKVGMVAGGGKAERALRKLRDFVETNCDYVGQQFPEEARKIHYGEADERGIYGEATPTEAEELVEEGISVGRLPWPSRSDA